MNTVKYLKTFALLAATLLIASCAEEATTQQDNGRSNQQEPNTKGLTVFVVEENDTKTRTTAEYFYKSETNRGLHYYWTAGDRLWVNNGGTLIQDASNNIDSKLENNPAIPSAVKRAAAAKFYFNGTFTAPSYPVRYTGKGSATGDKVTIKAQQTQTIPNDASHIGEDGDCGTAVATKPAGGGKYNFTLSHEASYITFLPYTTQGVISGAKLQKIKVSADQAICGTFDFNDNGIDIGSRPTAAPANQSIELSLNSFSIPNTATIATNAAAMVIAPGSYTHFTVEYTLHDPITNATGVITKQYPGTVTFTKGKNKRVSQDLQVTVYGDDYYMWDAEYEYWADLSGIGGTNYKQYQPKPGVPGDYNKRPKSKAADPKRWYNEVDGPAAASHSAKNCPNANEAWWYVQYGDARWENRLWATMGHLFTGGIWLKKQSTIVADNPLLVSSIQDLKDKAPNGTDYTTSSSRAEVFGSLSLIPPSPSDYSKYFFLPALGDYSIGGVWGGCPAGEYGFYWVSTAMPNDVYEGYRFYFRHATYGDQINMYHPSERDRGFRIWKADDSDNQYRPLGM